MCAIANLLRESKSVTLANLKNNLGKARIGHVERALLTEYGTIGEGTERDRQLTKDEVSRLRRPEREQQLGAVPMLILNQAAQCCCQ